MKCLRIGTITLILFTLLVGCSTPQPTATDTPLMAPTSTSTLPASTGTPVKTTPTDDTSLDEKTSLPMTATPTVCTGWRTGVSGTVYGGEARSGNELAGVGVTLTQISSCSTTAGEYQTVTDPDGSFRFGNLYIHDMDAIDILIEHDGYKTFEQKWGGLELYNQGFSVEIVLKTDP